MMYPCSVRRSMANYDWVRDLMHGIWNHSITKNEIREVVDWTGVTRVSGVKAGWRESPRDPHRAVCSGVGVVLDGFQVRGLETISTSRRNGRGPGGSLKRLRIFDGENDWRGNNNVTKTNVEVIDYQPYKQGNR